MTHLNVAKWNNFRLQPCWESELCRGQVHAGKCSPISVQLVYGLFLRETLLCILGSSAANSSVYVVLTR